MRINLPKQCKECAHGRLIPHDYNYRCARCHDSLCYKAYRFCDGKYFFDKNKGISLYIIKNWINSLSSDELQMPLMIDIRNIDMSFIIVQEYNSLLDTHWHFYIRDDKHE